MSLLLCQPRRKGVYGTRSVVSELTLLVEHNANEARFKLTYMGKWITVEGRVDRIREEAVYLQHSYFTSAFDSIILHGIPIEVLAGLDIGSRFTATCKLTDSGYEIEMSECRVAEKVTQAIFVSYPESGDPPACAITSLKNAVYYALNYSDDLEFGETWIVRTLSDGRRIYGLRIDFHYPNEQGEWISHEAVGEINLRNCTVTLESIYDLDTLRRVYP